MGWRLLIDRHVVSPQVCQMLNKGENSSSPAFQGQYLMLYSTEFKAKTWEYRAF